MHRLLRARYVAVVSCLFDKFKGTWRLPFEAQRRLFLPYARSGCSSKLTLNGNTVRESCAQNLYMPTRVTLTTAIILLGVSPLLEADYQR